MEQMVDYLIIVTRFFYFDQNKVILKLGNEQDEGERNDKYERFMTLRNVGKR